MLSLRCLTFAFLTAAFTNACTNVLVTPGASENQNAMIAYNADSANLMGLLYHYPASKPSDADASAGDDQGDNKKTMRKVWNWDTAVYLGEIPEAKETFNVVGKSLHVL